MRICFRNCALSPGACEDHRHGGRGQALAPGGAARSAFLGAISAIEQLSKRGGIFPGVLLMPVLPFIEDNEAQPARHRRPRGGLRRKVHLSADRCDAARANQRQWYYERLDERFPGLREKYEGNLRRAIRLRFPAGGGALRRAGGCLPGARGTASYAGDHHRQPEAVWRAAAQPVLRKRR